jgi:hypothetical protein
MHKKEEAIAPILNQGLGLEVIVPENFNTDRFGTFTRDIKRRGTQVETAKAKVTALLEATGETLGIASEGSFYPHPGLPMLSCDREIILLTDRLHGLEVIGEAISTETNFNHATITSAGSALSFAQKVGFPEHGLVVMPAADTQEPEQIFKGITNTEDLLRIVEQTLQNSPHRTAHIETDMRAMFNPTRMQVIAQATQNLLDKLHRLCPQCDWPGFDLVATKKGLPCSLCHLPTNLIKAEIHRCQKCSYRQEILFPQGISVADPTYCQFCNP